MNNIDNMDNEVDAEGSTSPLLINGKHDDEKEGANNDDDQKNEYGAIQVVLNPNETQDSTMVQNTSSSNSSPLMTHMEIAAILSTAFAYACIMTTFFLLVGPVECQRIEDETTKYYTTSIGKSIALGGFAGLAGLAQLITPIIGLLSDSYIPKPQYLKLHELGKRMPYLILGTVMVVIGLVGCIWSSSPIHPVTVPDSIHDDAEHKFIPIHVGTSSHIDYSGAWFQYSIFFLASMLGLNIVYTVMLVLIPDLVPPSQTGIANGTLALLLVSGSLFGFFSFHVLLDNNVMGMYKMYVIVSIITAILTCVYSLDRENVLNLYNKTQISSMNDESKENKTSTNNQEESQVTEIQPIISSTTTTTPPTQQNDNTTEDDYPTFPQLTYYLLYEPIEHKTKSELLSAYWIDTTDHRDFFIVTISRFFYYMGISSQTFFLYFIHDMLRQSARTQNPEAAVALLAIVGQSSGAITCYPVGILSDQYLNGRRKPFVYSACILLSIGNLALLYCHTLSQMIWVCVLLGASNGMYLTMDTSLAVDTLDIDSPIKKEEEQQQQQQTETETKTQLDKEVNELEANIANDTSSTNINEEKNEPSTSTNNKNNDHGAAQLLGIWGVFGFVGSALGPLIGGTALLLLGHIPKTEMSSSTSSTTTAIPGFNATTTLSSQDAYHYYYNYNTPVTTTTTTTIPIDTLPTTPFYKFQGYEALFCLSAFYFFCSAVSLAFVRKKGV